MVWPRHRPSPRRSELSRATSSRWCSANVSIYSRCKCTDPRRLKALARGTEELLSTAPHSHTTYIACRTTTGQASHLENSTIQTGNVEGYTDLEWPIDARNRRNVLCACCSHAQTRPEITPYPKSAHNGTSNSAHNSGCATDRSPIKMKMRDISIKT